MGVVGGMFSVFLHSIPFALMPPLSFALRPERWPQSVSYFRATLSAGPNFGYHLCATRIPGEALADVDLRSWRIAFNGAEPVRPATLRLWQDRMGPLGFVPEAMQPCYGMAEVGLAMALSQPGIRPRVVHVDRIELAGSGRVVSVPADHPNAQALTAVGRPLPGYQVRVIGAHGTDLPERRHGQLLLSGPSLTGGYLTADGTVPDNPRDGWLSTGDLGFFAEGDLFVTGRTKDLIVIAGRNYLPDDIEEAAGGLNGVRRGALAALSVPNPDTGTESLVIVVESPIAHIPDKAAELVGQIERAITERTGLRPDRVVVIRPGGLPKTSSGKLQRHKIASSLGGETFSAS
jgi:acyl-CoA synthetase (AMP-forming)/AMP-acid ligase II